MAITRQQVEGGEFDWFAVDKQGYLSLCSSAGFGEIPPETLLFSSDVDSPIQHLEALIESLEVICEYKTEHGGTGNCQEWKELGRRGVYVYDWKHWAGPYERVVVPEKPILAASIPIAFLRSLVPIVMQKTAFATCLSFQLRTGYE